MHQNPFSPSFSIRPERFYGRKQEISLVEEALSNPDSPNRYLFITGTRGSGKTSLLHQLALSAKKKKWDVCETTYQNALETLRDYAGITTAITREVNVRPSVSVAGIGASAGSVSKQISTPPAQHLSKALCERLAKGTRKKKLFITIDEVQKITERDIEEISHAVQDAKTQGHAISLIIAGLPTAYSKIRRYKGCTFVQRMRRYKLGLLGVEDTYGFLTSMFSLVPEIKITQAQIDTLAQFSAGHPYLLQLVGDYVYTLAVEAHSATATSALTVTDAQIHDAKQCAFADYYENILKNLLSGMRQGTKEYFKVMCELCDETSTVDIASITKALSKTPQECSALRARVIDLQLAHSRERGKLTLSLPYIPTIFEENEYADPKSSEAIWTPPKNPF